MNSRLPNQITVERGIGEARAAIWKGVGNRRKTRRTPTWRANCRCFPHGGSHQRVNLYACSLFQMVMQEDTKIYPGSGKRRPYVQRGREVCIILHLSACIGVNTGVVWSVCVLLRMGVVLLSFYS